MALSQSDLESVATLLAARQPADPQPHKTIVAAPSMNVSDVLTKLATAISLALLMWVGRSVSEMRISQALIVQEQSAAKEDRAELKRIVDSGTRDRYSRAEALDDKAQLVEQLLSIKSRQAEGFTRLEKLEQKLAIMEATK